MIRDRHLGKSFIMTQRRVEFSADNLGSGNSKYC